MSKSDWWALIVTIWTSGILTEVAISVIRFVNANTKNKRVLLFTKWAEQAVKYAEKHGETNQDKKRQATQMLYDRLFANKMPWTFSDEQIDAEIETAVAKLHDTH